MQIYKNGEVVYTSIDNTGSTDDAALGARYAKGRLDTLDSRFDDYISKEEMYEDVVTKDDFVTSETEKTTGIEVVLPPGPTESSPNDLNIDDSEEMRHSTVHTSSNHYINTKLDTINNALVGKMSIQFVEELPASPERNTQYYVETEDEGVWDIYVSDSLGVVRNVGTTELSMDGYVRNTLKIAGIDLEADISAQQLDDAIKDLTMSTKQDSLTAEDVETISEDTKVSGIDLAENKSLDTTMEDISKYLADKFFPIGSLYTTTSDDDPADILGVGTWTIVAADRVLWGVSASTTAGSTLSEQLPNVKGDLDFSTGGQGHAEITGSGAFKMTNVTCTYPDAAGTSGGGRKVNFNASRSSSTYKDNATVRPAAYTVHIWERTA